MVDHRDGVPLAYRGRDCTRLGARCVTAKQTTRSVLGVNVRRQVLQHLATPEPDNRFGAPYLSRYLQNATGCRPHEAMEALWGLVADGLIFLDPSGQGSGTDNWRWMLSADGRAAAAGGAWEPRDPEGYLSRLRRKAPKLDGLALRYVQEALQAFNARCYLACSIMLGVASEQAFRGLAEAFVATADTQGGKLKGLLLNPRSTYAARFDEFRKRLEPVRADLPYDLADVLTLDAVADLLRVTRNSVGHPTGADVDEDTARVHLQMAALYLRKMTDLRQHFARQALAQD